jgi:ketosteroid isomerase-like protein
MKTRVLVIPVAMMLAGACHRRGDEFAPSPARLPARDTLFALDQSRTDSASARGVSESMLALLSPDAAYLRAGVPALYGIDAIRAMFAANPETSGTSMTWQPLGGGISNDLRAAYTYGIAARVTPRAPVRLERYIAYWRRDARAPWRIAAYSEVGAPPASEGSSPAERMTPPNPTLPRAMAQARSAVRAADSLFADLAYRMGTGYAFAATVAQDGVIFGNPQLVIGPQAVQDFFAGGAGSSLSWQPVYASVAASRDLGFTIGEYTSTGRGPTGAAVQRFGKYLTVWRLQSDGTWKFVVDGGNPTPSRGGDR